MRRQRWDRCRSRSAASFQLVRHFLERFFNHETASPGGGCQVAAGAHRLRHGLPGFVVALYLWPVYHRCGRRASGAG